MREGFLIVILGFVGIGKGIVVGKFFEKNLNIKFLIFKIMRKLRLGEKEGVNYFFVLCE